jgi:hypothetical protein
MDSKTTLIDPASATQDRLFYRIPAGLKFYASKVRLLNFYILNNDSQPIYYGPRGIYQLIKKISLLSMAGTEIDFLSDMDAMAIKMMHLGNSSQYSLAREMFQNMGLSITAPSFSQIELTEAQGKADGTKIQGYIDISFALGYLQARNICDEGFTLSIELETSELVHGIPGGYTFSTPPALALDECLSGMPADKADSYAFTTFIPDRLYINPIAAGTTEGALNQTQTRLNAYYNQYISNLWYYLDYNVEDNTNFNPYHLAHIPAAEELQVVIDGRRVLMFNGVNTPARKLALLGDFSGEVCLPGVAPYYYGVGSTIPLIPDSSGVAVANAFAYGLLNPNTRVRYNNILSYGLVKLEQFIQIDLAVYYTYSVTGTPTAQYPAYLRTMAEVLRSYNKRTDMISNVQQKPGAVNTM